MAPLNRCRRPFRQKRSTVALFIIGFLCAEPAMSRRWEDVVSVAIYAQSNVDIARIQYSAEDDPWSSNGSPTLLESQPPSDAPSSVPSYYDDADISTNMDMSLNCPDGFGLYSLNKYDNGGEGWGETSIMIREMGPNIYAEGTTYTISRDVVLEDDSSNSNKRSNARSSFFHRGLQFHQYALVGNLRSGSFGSQHVCLSGQACYEMTAQNSNSYWLSNAKWEVVQSYDRDTSLGNVGFQDALVTGKGIENCRFSVSEEGLESCPNTCQTQPGKQSLGDSANTTTPRTTNPTLAPGSVRSMEPSMAPISLSSVTPQITALSSNASTFAADLTMKELTTPEEEEDLILPEAKEGNLTTSKENEGMNATDPEQNRMNTTKAESGATNTLATSGAIEAESEDSYVPVEATQMPSSESTLQSSTEGTFIGTSEPTAFLSDVTQLTEAPSGYSKTKGNTTVSAGAVSVAPSPVPTKEK